MQPTAIARPARPAGPLGLNRVAVRAISVPVAGVASRRMPVDALRSPIPIGPAELPLVARATPQNASAVVQSIVELTNHVRADNQAPALSPSPKLMEAAQIHSRDMAAADTMAHTLPGAALPSLTGRADAVHYAYARLGENIAYNQADASSVVAAWMNSPPHRENMLNSSFTDIGVGLAWNARGEPYYTMMLGRPS